MMEKIPQQLLREFDACLIKKGALEQNHNLFRNILNKEFGKIEGMVRAKRRPYIPVVLSREEVDLIILKLRHPYDLIVKLLYGCGLKLFECMQALFRKRFNPLSNECSLPNVPPPIPFGTVLPAICSRQTMISGPSRNF
jgi:hypothetical protein